MAGPGARAGAGRRLTTPAGTTHSTQALASRSLSSGTALAGTEQRAGATINAKWHPFSWSRFKSCMLDAQVSWALLAVFAAVCGAAGVVTAGTALVACWLSVGLPAGAMGACVAYATYW